MNVIQGQPQKPKALPWVWKVGTFSKPKTHGSAVGFLGLNGTTTTMKFFSAAILTMCVCLLAGCSSPGVLISTQDKDTPPKIGSAPADGNYGLFIKGDQQELLEFPLKQGDPLGFAPGPEGPVHFIYWVAGNQGNRLDVRQVYEWRRQP